MQVIQPSRYLENHKYAINNPNQRSSFHLPVLLEGPLDTRQSPNAEWRELLERSGRQVKVVLGTAGARVDDGHCNALALVCGTGLVNPPYEEDWDVQFAVNFLPQMGFLREAGSEVVPC